MKNKTKCKMTITGKHIFGIKSIEILIPDKRTPDTHSKFYKVCEACGMIDDRKKK
jgi:hypothetical protein